MNSSEVFSRNLRMLLAVHHMTQTRLSEMLNLDTSTVNRLVNGKATPSLETAAAVADIFGVTVDWLSGRDTCSEYAKNPNNNIFEEDAE